MRVGSQRERRMPQGQKPLAKIKLPYVTNQGTNSDLYHEKR